MVQGGGYDYLELFFSKAFFFSKGFYCGQLFFLGNQSFVTVSQPS